MKIRDLHIDYLLGVALLTLMFWVCGAFGAQLPDYRKLPGWRKANQCHPFACSFVTACNDAGIPAARVAYDWRTSYGSTGRHAVVVFKREGKVWAMDNQHLAPWPVCGTNDVDMFRASGAYRSVNIITLLPQPAQTLDQLFLP